jgi:outer membrane receptor protein involved in Fe transport
MRKQQEASMKGISGRVRFSSTSFFLVVALWIKPADAQMLVHFDLPAQPLGQSLNAIGTATNTNVGFTASQVAGLLAPPLKADLTVDGALTRVLVGTGLRPKHLDDHTILITATGALTADSRERRLLWAKASSATEPGDQLVPSQAEAAATTDNPSSSNAEKKDLEEIVVTGTHIAGAPPVGSPLHVVSATDIANSGYSTIGDVIRSLPESFGGGINPGVVGTTNVNTSQNVAASSTVNLRGLGSDSTLTLIDGHRVAVDGFTSSFDVSAIPLAAIERVEILTDSASSVYGSDAVAGVANFILKKNYEGAETSARFGGASNGGATEREASQLLGTNWGSGNAMVSYEFYDQGDLLTSERSFSASALSPQTLFPSQNRNSVFASAHQNIFDNVSAYVEGLYSDRKSDTISNTATPAYSLVNTTIFSVSSGLTINLTRAWTASIDGTLSSGKDAGVAYYISGGVPATLDYYYANRTASIEASTAGTLFALPSGPVEAALGAGYRSERYHDADGTIAQRHLDYEFAELRIPVVQADRARLGLERLELSVSGRHEDYSDFGTNTSPKLGILYAPTRDLSFRGSWGKAFRAPDLENEYAQRQLAVFPASFFGAFPVGAQALYQSGANSSLQPETARSWTTGVDYKPDWAPALRASLTYYNIDYRNRITLPIADFAASLSNPVYAPFVIRNPSAALQSALFNAPDTLIYNFVGGAYDPRNVIALIKGQYQNAAGQQAHGVDLNGHYGWRVFFGDLDVSINATWLTLAQLLTPTSPEETISGTVFYPPKFRSRLGITWQRGAWSAASFVNYVSKETDNTNTSLPVGVASWTTVDAQIKYEMSNWGGFFRGMGIRVASQNLFNRNPPALGANSTFPPSIGYDSTNASPLGRFVSVTLRKDW